MSLCFHSMFILQDGTVKACGQNNYGQLGLGDTDNRTFPVDLSIEGVRRIACGNSHTMFIMQDGTVKACGNNSYGQLGLGDTNNRTSPVDLSIEGVKQIVCGNTHTVFILQDGTVKAYGQNDSGQLGLGDTDNRTSPVDLSIEGVKSLFDYLPIILLLVRSINDYYTYDLEWIDLGDELSSSLFIDNGMENLPDINTIFQLDSPEVYACTDDENNPTAVVGFPDTEIYYAISIVNITYYSYRNGVWFPVTDIYNEGMTEEEIEALTVEDFAKIFVPGNLYIKAVLKSNDENETPAIYSVKVNLPESYIVGSYYIITDNAMQLNTLDWKQINSCIIEQTTPTDTDVRYAFSNNNKGTWQVYKNNSWSTITLNNISTEGMTKEEVESLTSKEWKGILKNTLDVAICLLSENGSASPEVDQITFDYDRIDSPMVSNAIRLPVPETGFRYVLEVDDSYTLKIAQGIAFDDAEIDYDFYTTPNKIKLRPLDMGNVTGGKYSDIYAVEVINGYEEEDFNIILYASKGGQDAEPKGSYGLFHDAERETNRTWIEFSFTGGAEFNPTYPLQFRLDRDSSKIFYVRIKPTLTTTGYDTFQIRLIGRAV